MKKKTIKLVTASAIAASAFVAAAPAQTDAASSVDSVVSKAVTQMKKAYHTYSDVTAKGQFANMKDVYAQYNVAKKEYTAAKTAVLKAGGSQKDARLELLESTYKEYIAKRVVTYIDAYNYAVQLAAKTEVLKAAVAAGDLDKAEAAYHDISRELTSRTIILDRVYGKSTRELLKGTFKAEAEKLAADVKVEVSVKMAADAVSEALANKDNETAKLALEKVSKLLSQLDNNAFGQAVAAEMKAVKEQYESTLTPFVLKVEALNTKQIRVSFNTELNADKTLAADASETALYSVRGAQPTSAVLSEDKKSVLLTFAASIEGNDQVVVVNPVLTTKKDKDGNLVSTAKYTEVLSYTDSVKPTVTGTEYKNGKIVVSFSEEIATLPTVVRVNGIPVTVFALSTTDSTKLEIPFVLAAEATASLYIAGAKDTAAVANEIALFNGSVQAPGADKVKPVITNVEVTGQNTAKVTLSEEITQTTVAATLQQGATQTAVTLVKDTTDASGKTYLLNVSGLFAGTATSETFTLFVAASAMTDSADNKSDLFNTSLTFLKDVKAPVLVASQVSSDSKKLEFKFDEALTVAGSDSAITIRNAEGVNITAVDAETGLKADDSKTFLVDTKATDVALDAGTYTVSIPAGFFTDAQGNKSAAVTSTFTVNELPASADKVKPTASVTNTAGAANEFEVAYSEEVTASALNLSNYKLDGVSLPVGTDISFTSAAKNTVKIVLPANFITIGNQTVGASAILNVSGTADKAGNIMDAMNQTVIVKDNTAAVISNVDVMGQDVYVTFNDDITVPASVDALAAFKVTVNGTELTAAEVSDLVAVNGNTKQVKFTLTATPAVTPVVTVKEAQTALKDLNGVNVK